MDAYFWILPALITAVLSFKRPELIRKMIWAGVLALPVLLLPTVLFTDFQSLPTDFANLTGIIDRLLTSFFLGAVAAALYETVLRKHFSSQHVGNRASLLWLLIGPAIVLVGLWLDRNIATLLFVSLLVDITILLLLRADLLFDVVFSATTMGLLYVALFLLNYQDITGSSSFWFGSSLSGVVILGLPIEELALITAFGGLWGPIYVAIKDLGKSS